MQLRIPKNLRQTRGKRVQLTRKKKKEGSGRTFLCVPVYHSYNISLQERIFLLSNELTEQSYFADMESLRSMLLYTVY
jgi:hypothetical protein